MRKLFAALVTGSALFVVASPAMANGLKDSGCCQTANFGGWYVGVHGGGGITDLSATLFDDNDLAETLHVNKTSFGLWGLHGGFNLQVGQACCSAAVVGIEVDHSWTNASKTFLGPAEVGLGNDSVGVRLRSLSSLRGRAGVVVNNLMLYGTGGLAWARTSFNYVDVDMIPDNKLNISGTNRGLVGGVGAEWYLTKVGPGSVLLRAEYLHYAFGRDDLIPNALRFDIFTGGTSSIANRFSSVDTVRVGLDLKFP